MKSPKSRAYDSGFRIQGSAGPEAQRPRGPEAQNLQSAIRDPQFIRLYSIPWKVQGFSPFRLFPFSSFPSHNARGVTLLELILVLVILTIIAGLVVPTIGNRLQRNDIRRDALQLRAALSFMRLGAVREGREAVFVVDPRNNSYHREPGGESVAIPEDSGQLSARGRWTREEGEVEFRFYPDGTNSGGEVRLERRQGVSVTAYIVSLDPLLGTATLSRDEE